MFILKVTIEDTDKKALVWSGNYPIHSAKEVLISFREPIVDEDGRSLHSVKIVTDVRREHMRNMPSTGEEPK